MLAIKAGGSVITREGEKPVFDRASARRLAAALSRLKEPCLLVHGTGSFGKPPARRYGYLSGAIPAGKPVPVPAIRAGLARLHGLLLSELARAGVRALSCPGREYFRLFRGRPLLCRKTELRRLLRSGRVPVVNSDIFDSPAGLQVVSSDALLAAACEALKPRLAVFLTGADGLLNAAGEPVPAVSARKLAAIRRGMPEPAGDVSGGMKGKLAEVIRIAAGGSDVLLANGKRPEIILEPGIPGKGTYVHASR
jgi:glutamate 5-kinase